jgi:hypothetical protein
MSARDLAWIVATVLGLAGGGFVLHFPGSYGDQLDLGAGIFGFVLGFANGVGLGILQGVALGVSRSRGVRVAIAMGIVVGVTHGLHDGTTVPIPYVVVALVAGVGVAAVMALLLGVRDRRSLGVAGIGWAIGLVVALWIEGILGLPWSETPLGWSTDHAVNGTVVGLLWGVATAVIGLPRQLRSLAG